MKPTQEQVIAWAREAGIKRCDCDPRCHLQTGGIGCITALVALAYEAGRKDENEACAEMVKNWNPEFFEHMTQEYAVHFIRARREQ